MFVIEKTVDPMWKFVVWDMNVPNRRASAINKWLEKHEVEHEYNTVGFMRRWYFKKQEHVTWFMMKWPH